MRARPAEITPPIRGLSRDPLESDGLLDELGLRAWRPHRSGSVRRGTQRLAFAVAWRADRRSSSSTTDRGHGPQGQEPSSATGSPRARRRYARSCSRPTSWPTTERLADRMPHAWSMGASRRAVPPPNAAGFGPGSDSPLIVRSTRRARRPGAEARRQRPSGRRCGQIRDRRPRHRHALVSAVAAWCESAGRLITEARTIGGTLEDAYLESSMLRTRRRPREPAGTVRAVVGAQNAIEARLTSRRGENLMAMVVLRSSCSHASGPWSPPRRISTLLSGTWPWRSWQAES